MGDRQHRGPSIPSRAEKFVQDHPLVAGIEIAGGFIREHQARPGDQGPADRRPLPLTLAETIHRTTGEPGDPEAIEEFGRMTASFAIERPGPEPEWKQDVPEDIKVIEEPEVLEHDPDPTKPQPAPGVLSHAVESGSVELDLAARRAEDPGGQPEQRGLATSTGADDRHRTTTRQLERRELEPEGRLAVAWWGIVESDAFESKHGQARSAPVVIRYRVPPRSSFSMRFDHLLLLILLPLVVGTPIACEDASNRVAVDPDRSPTVAVTNYPLRYFVERIAGDRVEVRWLVPDGMDPANWQPTADDVAAMGAADLVLLNGAGYEPWMETASLPSRIVVDTSAGFKDRLIETEDLVHAHGPDGSHSHGGTASHTWLDPNLAILQAQAVLGALTELVPADQERMQSNLGLLRRELLERSAGMEQAVNSRPDTAVVFSHPVYQYLQRRFGMDGESVHFEPDMRPGEAAIEELDALLASRPSGWFIWEGTPIEENRRLIEDLDLQGIVLDPGGAPPETGDLLDVLDSNVAALRTIYESADDS